MEFDGSERNENEFEKIKSNNFESNEIKKSEIKVGNLLTGKVSGFASFGAFVDLPGGSRGLVHISEISNGYTRNVNDELKLGQEVKIKVISLDGNRIGLSIKQATSEPLGDAELDGIGGGHSRRRSRSNSKFAFNEVPAYNGGFENMLKNCIKVGDEKNAIVTNRRERRGKGKLY
jgi:S1 RNA binding domain protein